MTGNSPDADSISGQSTVVGVAILLGVTVVALGTLTASIGLMVEEHAATADARRVAESFDRSLSPVETTGLDRGRVTFTDGSLRTVGREVRILDDAGVLRRVQVGGLVYATEGYRVAFVSGAIVLETPAGADLYAPPPIIASRRSGGVLVVGAARLNASRVSFSGSGATAAVLRTNVTHERAALPDGRYRVAIETNSPDAWGEYFERLDASVVARDRDFDGDGVGSVVARFAGNRTAYLVIHDMHLEVANG